MFDLKRIGLTAALLAGSVIAAQAAVITNGSFEDPGGTTVSPGFTPLNNGSTAIVGWTVVDPDATDGSVGLDYIGNYWSASDGDSSLDLNGGGRSGISTTITGLVAGQAYSIAFDMSGNPAVQSGGLPNPKLMDVNIGGSATQYSFNTNTVGNTLTDMKWQTNYFNFVAASAADLTLTFASAVAGNYGPALDNVRISAVPLPAAGLLLLGAMGGLGFVSRKRKAA